MFEMPWKMQEMFLLKKWLVCIIIIILWGSLYI